jgi:hypothetical protein
MSAPTAARRVTPTAVRVLPADADREDVARRPPRTGSARPTSPRSSAPPTAAPRCTSTSTSAASSRRAERGRCCGAPSSRTPSPGNGSAATPPSSAGSASSRTRPSRGCWPRWTGRSSNARCAAAATAVQPGERVRAGGEVPRSRSSLEVEARRPRRRARPDGVADGRHRLPAHPRRRPDRRQRLPADRRPLGRGPGGRTSLGEVARFRSGTCCPGGRRRPTWTGPRPTSSSTPGCTPTGSARSTSPRSATSTSTRGCRRRRARPSGR